MNASFGRWDPREENQVRSGLRRDPHPDASFGRSLAVGVLSLACTFALAAYLAHMALPLVVAR